MQSDSSAVVEPLREVGGYRVVRTLATSERGFRLLVHAEGRARAARVFDRECPDEVIDHQITVSDAVRSARPELSGHASAAVDLCSTADGRVVIIEEHLAGPRLDLLLRDRHSRLALGEAITILAPLVSAIDEGHRIGLTGLLADASAVRLHQTGAPVLTRFSGVRVGPPLPERFRDREPRYSADRGALERVGETIAAALSGDDQKALLSALQRSGPAIHHALFDLAPPLPVRLDSERPASVDDRASVARSTPPSVPPVAPGRAAEVGEQVAPLPLQKARAALSDSLDSLGLPLSVVSAVRDAADTIARVLERLAMTMRSSSSGRGRLPRPRFLLAGGAGAAALIVAIAVATSSSDPDAGGAGEAERSSEAGAARPTAAHTADDSASASSPGLAETELHPEPETWPALIGQLVDRWVDCAPQPRDDTASGEGADGPRAAASSRACAAAVVHAGSSASALILIDDQRHELLRAWDRSGGEAVVVERMGAAVIVDLVSDSTATASLLVVRSEAGWRIRDVIG